MSSGPFLMQCEKCGMKINMSAQQIGGDTLCAHKLQPISQQTTTATSPSSGSQRIVYPSDLERKWLRIMDQNKDENLKHQAKFKNDITTIKELKNRALQDIQQNIASLQEKLKERSKALVTDLNEKFNERQNSMYTALQKLSEHKKNNEETKQQSEDLLLGSTPAQQREKTIVTNCEKVINDTPRLQYIETELRYEFSSLDFISQQINEFGTLRIRPIDSGDICSFPSTSEASNAPIQSGPKSLVMPTIQFRQTTFDEKKSMVKLVFKVLNGDSNTNLSFNFMDHISIHVVSVECEEEEDEKEADFSTPTHEATVKFSDCPKVKNKHELYVDYKYTPGSNVNFKLRAIFTSPDSKKYKNGEGEWSRAQACDIPDIEFTFILNGQRKTLKVPGDDAVITNYNEFAKRFVQKFNNELKENETLILTAKSSNNNEGDVILNSSANLAKYTSNGNINSIWSINGLIIKPQPPKPDPVPQPEPEPEPKPKPAKSQISIVLIYNGNKKRVNLKNNKKKKLYEYKIDILKKRVLKKFEKNSLSGNFVLETNDGQQIGTDDDIINILGQMEKEKAIVNVKQ